MSDLDAKYYRENSSFQHSLAQEVLENLDLKGNETILDLGCGDGRMAAELSGCVPHGRVLGVDPSSSMIDLASTTFQPKDYPNLSFKKASAEEMSLGESVDIILFMNALHWIKNPHKALQNIAHHLKPGGRLFILTFPKESLYWKFLDETAENYEWVDYPPSTQSLLHSKEYHTILENLGFSIENFRLEDKIAIYSSQADLISYMKGWINCYLPLERELENQFLQKAAKNAISYSLKHPGIHLQYTSLMIQAVSIQI